MKLMDSIMAGNADYINCFGVEAWGHQVCLADWGGTCVPSLLEVCATVKTVNRSKL